MQKLRMDDCLAFLNRAGKGKTIDCRSAIVNKIEEGHALYAGESSCFMYGRKLIMHKLTEFFKPHLADVLEKYRKKLKLTQGRMAEKMAISARYYYDLKRGISMMSAIELILVLKLLSDDDKLNLIHEVENLTESEAYKDYLDKIDFI